MNTAIVKTYIHYSVVVKKQHATFLVMQVKGYPRPGTDKVFVLDTAHASLGDFQLYLTRVT